MGLQIGLDVRSRDAQRHAMLLQEAMDFVPGFEAHQPPHLTLMKHTGPIGLDGDGLELRPRQVRPFILQRRGDVIGKIDGDLHGSKTDCTSADRSPVSSER